MIKNLVLKLEYDGTNYNGWQSQINGNTIQDKIENALEKVFHKKMNLIGAGRTDAGVHARNYIANSSIEFETTIPEDKISNALNSYLPNDIRIIEAIITEKEFNSRYSAIARQYGYFIHLSPSVFLNRYSSLVKYRINLNLLFESAEIFIGKHNFTPFSKKNEDTKNYICNVEKCFWQKLDENRLKFTIKSDRFVYGMVRTIVGTMIDVARGKKTIEDIRKEMSSENRDNISPLAPAKGLFLEKIYYPEDLDFFKENN